MRYIKICVFLCLYSRYRLTLKYNWSQLVTPIYRSKKGTKFDSWVSTLAGYLSSKVIFRTVLTILPLTPGLTLV